MKTWAPILLILAAAAGVVLWLRKGGAVFGASQPQIGSVGQVGSTSVQEVSEAVVRAALEMSSDNPANRPSVQEGCWAIDYVSAAHNHWKHTTLGITTITPRDGQNPYPACGLDTGKSRAEWLTIPKSSSALN